MKISSYLGMALLSLPLALQAAPAAAKFSGEYTVTFFSGPSHGETGTQCIVFTHGGDLVGFGNSGTWDSTTFGGWGGNYIVDSGTLRWYGTFNSGGNVTNFYTRLGSGAGGFDDWAVSAPPISATNDGTTTLTAGCADARPHSHSVDPTK